MARGRLSWGHISLGSVQYIHEARNNLKVFKCYTAAMSTLNTQILVSKTISTDTNHDLVPMCGTSIGIGQGEPDKQLVSPESKVSSNT